MELWTVIKEFPDYQVSNYGAITGYRRNDRVLNVHRNQQGILSVMLRRDGVAYRRSVAGLVAAGFLRPSEHGPIFNTPIHLDGNRENCFVENLMWRPRWFSVRYHQQFKQPYRESWYWPVLNIDTGERYTSLIEASMIHGFLMKGLYPDPDGVFTRPTWPDNLRLAYIESDIK